MVSFNLRNHNSNNLCLKTQDLTMLLCYGMLDLENVNTVWKLKRNITQLCTHSIKLEVKSQTQKKKRSSLVFTTLRKIKQFKRFSKTMDFLQFHILLFLKWISRENQKHQLSSNLRTNGSSVQMRFTMLKSKLNLSITHSRPMSSKHILLYLS